MISITLLNRLFVRGAALSLTAALGCSATDTTTSDQNEINKTGARLSVGFLADTDVTAFRITIKSAETACNEAVPQQNGAPTIQPTAIPGGPTLNPNDAPAIVVAPVFETIVVTKEIESLSLPGELLTESKNISGKHAFVDHFTVLRAGCYDLKAEPMAKDVLSASCTVASLSNVTIQAGQVKEIRLESQCAGEETGALDTSVTSNRPPTITAVTFSPSKFVQQCQTTQMCVEVSDPDGDVVRLNVLQTKGGQLFSAPPQEVVLPRSRGVNGESRNRTCFDLVASDIDDYAFTLTAYDVTARGNTIERAAMGENPAVTSHTTLQGVPLFVGWQAEAQCFDGTTLRTEPKIKAMARVNGCTPMQTSEYFCGQRAAGAGYDLAVTCPNGQFEPAAVFPQCSDARPAVLPTAVTPASPAAVPPNPKTEATPRVVE